MSDSDTENSIQSGMDGRIEREQRQKAKDLLVISVAWLFCVFLLIWLLYSFLGITTYLLFLVPLWLIYKMTSLSHGEHTRVINTVTLFVNVFGLIFTAVLMWFALIATRM